MKKNLWSKTNRKNKGGSMTKGWKNLIPCIFIVVVVIVIAANAVYAFKERTDKNDLEMREFTANELYISQTDSSLSDVINQLPNRNVWQKFLEQNKNSYVHI